MARTLPTQLAAEFQDDELRPFFAVQITFPDANGNDVVNKFWTGLGNLFVSPDTYTGLGDLLSVSDVTENADLGASGLKIQLQATSEFVTILRDRKYQGKKVEAYIGALNENGSSIGQVKFFDGFADQMTFSQTKDAINITLTAENKLIRLSKGSGRTLTYEDQNTYYPNDTGLKYMVAIQEQELTWGK